MAVSHAMTHLSRAYCPALPKSSSLSSEREEGTASLNDGVDVGLNIANASTD
jgi:hypothetical protein